MDFFYLLNAWHAFIHTVCKIVGIVSTKQQTIIFSLAFISIDFLFAANEMEKCLPLHMIFFSVASSCLSHPLCYCYELHIFVYRCICILLQRVLACVLCIFFSLFGIQYHFKRHFFRSMGISIHILHIFIQYKFQYNSNLYKRKRKIE